MIAHRLCVPFVLFLGTATAWGQEPSYARQVKPFLARYCVECHPTENADGGLSLDTFKGLMAGGDHGPALVPGKPEQSRIVRMVEGKTGPRMPPRKSKQPNKEEILLLRTWVAAGARDDSDKVRALLPAIVPRHKMQPSIAALAYHPAGALLAAGRHRDLVLLDPSTGDVKQTLPGLDGNVTALAFDRAGTRLAAAHGEPGLGGKILLAACGKEGVTKQTVLEGHTDVIHSLVFSPDGKMLASCGYDRLVKLWDAGTGKLIRDLKDHSDAVYGLAFSPDGTLLASGGADRAVKVWDVAAGKRLYTLGESTDWVHAVAWSPDGKHLAAAGVDKSIRVWELNRDGGTIVHSVFAHEGPVNALVYSTDARTLYSLGQDRRVKAWEASRMVERQVYEPQSDTPLSLAVRFDGKQLAVGRFDGVLVLLDEKTGKVQAQPLPVKPKPPALKKLAPASGRRGKAIDLTCNVEGVGPFQLIANHPGVLAQPLPVAAAAQGSSAFRVTFPATTPAGVYQLRLKNEAGESAPLPFTVDLFDELKEIEPNDSPRTGQMVHLPVTISGGLDRAGEVDYFRFEAKAGQQVGVQLQVSSGTLEPVLVLVDPEGKILAESVNGVLGHTCATAGTYSLGVRDRDFRGGSAYRLHVGEVPVVTAVFPLGVRRGSEAEVHVEGVHLGAVRTVRVKAPADAVLGSRIPVAPTTSLGTPLGNPSLVVGEFLDVSLDGETGGSLAVDSTANGRLTRPGQTQTWKFKAKKGERLLLDVEARRLGSPLDSTIEILDAQGKPLPRAVLRCVARTYVTFRDHDSAGSGIRIETWSELAVNDYLHVGGELLRIHTLPKNPDDDCQFFSEGGRRKGQLGTTPGQLSLGTPMYKVTIHPPGTSFPPSGLPNITLFWRNDDGGAAWGKDSYLDFTAPADGEYLVRIGDARGQGSPQHSYRLTLRGPRPDFSVSFSPTAPAVWQGGAIPLTVTASRRDGFDGPIRVQLENLPAGFSAPVSSIPAGENSTAFSLFADASAKPATMPLKLSARAHINGKEALREAMGGLAKTVPAGDIMTTTEQAEVTVRPGGQARLTVRIERRNFTGRVPLDVRGLPHGVRVLDIGLNGILINPAETVRTIVIQCDAWVQPTEQPFVVLARRESKNTEHAAKSVLLKVVR
jgi:dipeptidyl aminopeptidase/acylaminoacyl peptidase